MYQLFDFEKRDCIVQGYHFPCEAPHHVVCLIHGIGEHAGRFSRVADYFNHAGIAVVSMDLRGHGRSQGVRGACAPRVEVLKDIDALIEYALYGSLPDLDDLPDVVALAFELVRPNLDASRRKAGGGAVKKSDKMPER